MDKPNRGNTIKIKLNGETQTFSDEPIKKNQESSKDSFTKVITIDEDNSGQDGFLETAAAKDPVDESFDWIIPESSDNDIKEYKVVNSQKSNKGGKKKPVSFSTFSTKRNGGVFKSILVTAVFAILIGTSFGVLMLNLVISDNSKPAVTEPAVEDTGPDKDSKATGGKSSSIVIGAQTAFIVQGGAFSSKDAASGAANEAKGKGAPAQTLTMNEREFMFLGVADSIETAKQMESHYEANGFDDVLPKQIPIAEKTVSDINESEKFFLEAAPAIYQQLSKVTSNAIVSGSISSEASKEVMSIGDQLSQSADLKNEKVKNLNDEISSALGKVEAFQEKKKEDSLIEAQQHLLNFLSIYYSL
ncbi:SPOR domain-containing protein [Bacillus sp. EB106-08-02-XG196]|uniref:SPOR domain-containing protein n=1 Tax=Bacillus sp. EB106-08-02-XG196 TaxID=2737049 RepID=UPI0015C45C52|nr:SPOR domain-containing protein [Bacillus sp. EB106-08-02-XG196]NWQ40196.1 SPOR domain-containing protein [Bacillus sp. EB106-08-02-XG196]